LQGDKKSRTVGTRDRETKEITILVRSFVPISLRCRSKISSTRFLITKKAMSRRSTTLILIRAKTRTLPLTGKGNGAQVEHLTFQIGQKDKKA